MNKNKQKELQYVVSVVQSSLIVGIHRKISLHEIHVLPTFMFKLRTQYCKYLSGRQSSFTAQFG